MPTLSRLATTVVALLTLAPALAQDYRAPLVVGTAYDSNSGSLLYTERHFCSDDKTSCNIEYSDALGTVIAEKKLDYSLSLISPALTMLDYRQDLEINVLAGASEGMVVDAGFDNYVRSKWDELLSGRDVDFSFLVVGLDKPLNMRARREISESCGAEEVCLSIGMNSWLLGMLVDPIELSYSQDSQQLLRFSGVSNIKGAAGETLSVDILYQYGNETLLVGPLEGAGTAPFNF